jgi:RNA polymerase sigma-70 factor (ECF subfamily)
MENHPSTMLNYTSQSKVLSLSNGSNRKRVFEKEFLPHSKAMFNFALRLTFEHNDANDLVQETFLKAYRFVDSFEVGTNSKAWLFRILKNTFINEFRRKAKQPSTLDYNEIESFVSLEESVSAISNLKLEENQYLVGDEIANGLNSLSTEFRTILILSDLQGFKYDEMAKILDIPIGTVRSRLHRARLLLKDKLGKYARNRGYS